ncbi:hypothetical protein [Paenimyroides baculatum]|uniref:Phage abortive infection protein n=1 Tax=Paenimyroides baculatum TaxID=2608000 RepID=A0A5M6CGJ4_9FLAO|nr:hypothetical protein [Paenimyroides baculatum]KAA5534314.1 hypothetical protein F0460_09405 [Paenimyroides baculatum]
MKNKELKQKKYKTKLDKFIGEKFQKIYNKIGIAGSIFFGLIFLIGSIIFFIRLISNNYFSKFNFDLSDKNEVGDALGGLTAPFIGTTGVILTFLAFWVQFKFNKKQSKFYKKDKIDRKIDEYNKLLELIIINKSELFNKIKLLEVTMFRRTWISILDRYRKNSLGNIKLEILISSVFLECLEKELGENEASKIPNLENEVQKFIKTVILETVTLRKLLITFLKEVESMGMKKEKKIELINLFFDKFLILNEKTNTFIIYISFYKFIYTDKLRVDLLSDGDKEVLSIAMDNLLQINKEKTKEILSYIALNHH